MSKQNKAKTESDPRFARLYNDPIFKETPNQIKKIEIKDSRFEKMFTDKSFNDKLKYDEYGRKISINFFNHRKSK
jgi:hypothetical protein